MTNTTHLSEVRFSELGLLPVIQQAVEKTGFEFCTPIQAESLPISLAGEDVAGQAQTGTGKTAAFMLAVIQHLLNNPLEDQKPEHVRTLIMVPTRELAIQVAKDAEAFVGASGLKIALAYGGTGYNSQKQAILAGADILIGTPGRLIDFFKQKLFNLRRCQCLVLDEADTRSADRVEQYVYYPSNSEKIPLLVGLIQKLEPPRSIVFVNTKRNAEKIDDFLRGNDINAVMISGDVRQNKRQRYLKEFEDGKHSVLIATDVAARGLHIDDVTHVFNFDLPQIEEDYVHRIGRTARAGASGESHNFACEDTAFYLPDIEKYIGQKIPMADVTSELLPELKKPKRIERDRVKPHPKKGSKTNFGRSRKKPSGGGSSENKSGEGVAKKSRGPRRRRKPSPPKSDS